MQENKMSLELGATPLINTNKAETPLHTEAHRPAPEVERDEKTLLKYAKRYWNIII